MATFTRSLFVVLILFLAIVPGFSQVPNTALKAEKKAQSEAKNEEPRADGLRKIETRSSRDWDFDIHLDEVELEANIERAIGNAMRDVEVALERLERLEINIEPIEINVRELDLELDRIEVNIPDLDIDIDIEEIEVPDFDIDIDIDEDDWDQDNDYDWDDEEDEDNEHDEDDDHDRFRKDESYYMDKVKMKEMAEKEKEKAEKEKEKANKEKNKSEKIKDKSDKEREQSKNEKNRADGLKKIN